MVYQLTRSVTAFMHVYIKRLTQNLIPDNGAKMYVKASIYAVKCSRRDTKDDERLAFTISDQIWPIYAVNKNAVGSKLRRICGLRK